MIIILICSFKTQSTFVMLVYHCHYLACYCYFGFPLFSVVGDHFKRFYYRKWWYILSKFVQKSKVGATKFDSIFDWVQKCKVAFPLDFDQRKLEPLNCVTYMYNFDFSCRCRFTVCTLSCSSFFAFMRIVILIRSFKIWDHYSKGHS